MRQRIRMTVCLVNVLIGLMLGMPSANVQSVTVAPCPSRAFVVVLIGSDSLGTRDATS